MIINEKEQFLRSYLDIRDTDTLRLMTEASDSQDKLLVALTSKLYEKILEKYEKIDFSTISRSRGDITKIEKYDSLVECVEIIHKLVTEYREDTYPVDVVNSAIANIKSRDTMFKKAFVINAPVAVMTYNTMVLAIVESVSFLIATCVEYIKIPQAETFRMALDTVAYNNTKQNLLFESLASFNEGCKTGEFDSAMKVCMNQTRIKEAGSIDVKHDTPFKSPEEMETDDKEVVVHDDNEQIQQEGFRDEIIGTVGKVFYFIAKLLIPAIRYIVYWYYAKRQQISDWYTTQATLIEMNAMQLQYNSAIDIDKKKDIYNKQMKIAEKYRSKANKYNVDYTVAKKSAQKMIDDENRSFKAKDFGMDSTVSYDLASSALF